MVETFDAIVVAGAGSLGASVAYHLAARGLSVSMFDQFEPGSRTSLQAAVSPPRFHATSFTPRQKSDRMKFMVEEVLLSEKSRGIVIVGAGHAGCRAALALRTKGWDGRVCLINSEPGVPYERPPLSKNVLIGTKLVTECPMHPGDWLAENDIEYHSEIRAAAVRRDTKEIELSDGTAIPYGRLLLATGAEPRCLVLISFALHSMPLHLASGYCRTRESSW